MPWDILIQYGQIEQNIKRKVLEILRLENRHSRSRRWFEMPMSVHKPQHRIHRWGKRCDSDILVGPWFRFHNLRAWIKPDEEVFDRLIILFRYRIIIGPYLEWVCRVVRESDAHWRVEKKEIRSLNHIHIHKIGENIGTRFQAKTFSYKVSPSSFTKKGPSSSKCAANELQPGPPLNHNINGSTDESDCDSVSLNQG